MPRFPIQLSEEVPYILFFSKTSNPRYFCFSNFYYATFYLDREWWKTVEHYYQAHKSISKIQQDSIRVSNSPHDAKKLGREVELRPDWEFVKYDIMAKAVFAKFDQCHDIRGILLATGDLPIHEDSPYDRVWGWRNKGQDLLGKILISVRDRLKSKLEARKL